MHTVRQTVTLPGTGQRVPVAVSLARPLTEVDAALSRLALLLTALAGLALVQKGSRLSVMPVSAAEWTAILKAV